MVRCGEQNTAQGKWELIQDIICGTLHQEVEEVVQ